MGLLIPFCLIFPLFLLLQQSLTLLMEQMPIYQKIKKWRIWKFWKILCAINTWECKAQLDDF